MRCTHYMKEEIIRNSGEMMLNQYWEVLNSNNPYFTDMSDDNIIRANIHMLEKKLSIDHIEVDNLLMDKIRYKAREYLDAKIIQDFLQKDSHYNLNLK